MTVGESSPSSFVSCGMSGWGEGYQISGASTLYSGAALSRKKSHIQKSKGKSTIGGTPTKVGAGK